MLTKGFIAELASPHVQSAQQHIVIISNIYKIEYKYKGKQNIFININAILIESSSCDLALSKIKVTTIKFLSIADLDSTY